MSRIFRICAVAAGAVAVVGTTVVATGAHASAPHAAVSGPVPGGTITATGQGVADGPPDLLTISVGVQTSGASAAPTMTTNNNEATALIDKLKADGVAAKDIQTSQLSVNPNYSQPTPSSPPRVVSYTVVDVVTAKIHALKKAGMIIDDAVSAGGRDAQLQYVYYSLENDTPLQSAARADAVKRAQVEAQAMAAAAGVVLGPVKSVTDTSSQSIYPGYPYQAGIPAAGGATGSGGAVMAAPLQAGSTEVIQSVAVVFSVM